MQTAREGVIKSLNCYIYCNFQQNIPLFCAVSDFVVLRLIADVWQSRKLLSFFQGRDIGRGVTVELRVYPIPSPPTIEGLGERRKLPLWSLGWSPSHKRFLDVLWDFTHMHYASIPNRTSPECSIYTVYRDSG